MGQQLEECCMLIHLRLETLSNKEELCLSSYSVKRMLFYLIGSVFRSCKVTYFKKIHKVIYFGFFPTSVFLVKKIGHLAKDCLVAHVKYIVVVYQSNSVANTLLPHEIQPEKVFNTSSNYVWKEKSIDMLCSNPPQIALHECSKDALEQDIGMLVSTPVMEVIPIICLTLHCLNVVWTLCVKI